jgi:hypothetical protein
MKLFEGFAVNNGHIDTEEKCVHLYALKNNIPYKYFNKVQEIPKNWIPVGNIDWFLSYTNIKIDIFNETYPQFLRNTLKRNVWYSETLPEYPAFIKPGDKLKRFNGTEIPVSGHLKKQQRKGPYICSEIMNFRNEWRYYIDDGKILDAAWYSGSAENDIKEQTPPSLDILDINWPKGWVGDADFGINSNGNLCLIEVNPPFATGNYLGLDSEAYPKWIIDGYLFLKEKYSF